MKRRSGGLHYGYTTGSCATAAASAALRALLLRKVQEEAVIGLPQGKSVRFSVEVCELTAESARCCVRKNAGDDPDVTHGLLICAGVRLHSGLGDGEVKFLKGEGVGVVTLPGLGIEVGEPAINPVPRTMISEALRRLLDEHDVKGGVFVTVSVPGGEEVARKTLNARVGVKEGLSIIGTSGIVVPYSEEAYLDTIRKVVQVARHSGCRELVVTSGVRSERMLRPRYADLPDTAFVHYGNRIGKALDMVHEAAFFDSVVVGVMLAKATKLAQGELDLSSRTVGLNRSFMASLARRAGYGEDVLARIEGLELMRSIVDIVPFREREPLYELLARSCREVCRERFPEGRLTFVLMTMENGCLSCDGSYVAECAPSRSAVRSSKQRKR